MTWGHRRSGGVTQPWGSRLDGHMMGVSFLEESHDLGGVRFRESQFVGDQISGSQLGGIIGMGFRFWGVS